MKNILKSLILCTVIFLLIPVKSAFADTNAKPVTLNTPVTGTLADQQYDLYKVELTNDQKGYYKITMDPNQLYDLRNGYCIALYDSTYTSLYENDGVDSSTDLCSNVTFEPGTYYIKVSPTYSNEGKDLSGIPYTLKVNFTQDASWESEGNDTPATSNKIECGKTYTGSCADFEDTDIYKLTLASKSKISLSYLLDIITYPDTGNGFEIALYNKNMSKSYLSYKWVDSSFTSDPVVLSAGTYYIAVKVTQEFGNKPYCLPYSLKVNNLGTYVTLKFNSCSGSNVAAKDVQAGKAVGTLKTSERSGYKFLGWYTKKTGGKKVTGAVKISKDATVYAHWKKK